MSSVSNSGTNRVSASSHSSLTSLVTALARTSAAREPSSAMASSCPHTRALSAAATSSLTATKASASSLIESGKTSSMMPSYTSRDRSSLE